MEGLGHVMTRLGKPRPHAFVLRYTMYPFRIVISLLLIWIGHWANCWTADELRRLCAHATRLWWVSTFFFHFHSRTSLIIMYEPFSYNHWVIQSWEYLISGCFHHQWNQRRGQVTDAIDSTKRENDLCSNPRNLIFCFAGYLVISTDFKRVIARRV